MSIKGLLFYLCVYLSVVWVWALYQNIHSRKDILESGLPATVVGLVLLLVLVTVVRLFTWWRQLQAKAAIRTAVVQKPKPAVHEDDSDLAAMIAEANATLARAPAYAEIRKGQPLFTLPLYLLIGPEGSGKTSTFLGSDLDPQLLAGQASGSSPFASTRLCNLWLAKNAVFVELSGRVFSGDPGRWTQLLGVLRGKATLPLWRRLWGESDQRWQLRGVIGFCDVKELLGAKSDPQRLERQSRDWQERLRAVGEVFGVEFPVYQVFTKCDSIPYFPDFFRRLPESEASQILGCTLPLRNAGGDRSAEVFAQAEPKRLVASFRPLYHALADRRTRHLAHEPNPSRRPNVYEFPREFNRIRSSLVEFLTEVSRPVSLRPGPLLRGYYFTGRREVEAALDLVATRTDETILKPGFEATNVFSGDSTRIFQEGNRTTVPRGDGRGKLVLRWMFVSDVFNSVVLADQPPRKSVPSDPRLERFRRALLASVCGVCGLLCLAFICSFARNLSLMDDLNAATQAAATQKSGAVATLAELNSLDALRVPVERLTGYERGSRPWSLRWGLYSGSSELVETARKAYFLRFQKLLLNDLNGSLVTKLRRPAPGAAYQTIYDELRTHLMISRGNCTAQPALVSNILEVEAQVLRPADSNWQAVAGRQIDFYAAELAFGNPLPLDVDTDARDHAGQYLSQFTGTDRKYVQILANAERTLASPQRLARLASNYTQVLTGPGEVRAAFTKQGLDYVEKASKQANAEASGEPCGIGQVPVTTPGQSQDTGVAQAIQRKFIGDYIDAWRKFVGSFKVLPYAGPADAARKLGIMARDNSPLLAVFQMTADETSFQLADGEQGGQQPAKKTDFIHGALATLRGGEKAGGKASGAASSTQEAWSSPADIALVFQPVQCVVTPGSKTWITDKNKAYVESLGQLRDSIDAIAHGGNPPDPAVYQAAKQSYDKALGAARQIASGFVPVGNEGLDETVQRLLEEPIRLTSRFVNFDMGKAAAGQVNGDLRSFCGLIRSTLNKYPFQPSSQEDASIEELTKWFAPEGGAIWKFQAGTLGALTEKQGSQWRVKDPTKKPQVTNELLAFLNSAQAVTDAFFPAGATQPKLRFVLRPRLDPKFLDATLELEIDGRSYEWTSTNRIQKPFTWPSPPDSQPTGATAWIKSGALGSTVASRPGIWGIFRIIGDAEPRSLHGKIVEWKYSGGEKGLRRPIHPAPVQMEIVDFPGGVDVFNPQFYQGLKCPTRAVQ